jgi:hypothetical protein
MNMLLSLISYISFVLSYQQHWILVFLTPLFRWIPVHLPVSDCGQNEVTLGPM